MKPIITLFIFLLTLTCAPLARLAAAESSKPNIIFIYADDWGWGDLSCHGQGSKVTPEVRAKAFKRWDTNKDDILTLEEYQSGLKGQEDLEARFKNFDKNSDGKLTREEFVEPSAK